MLRHKDTTILSEINDFFTTSEKAMNTIFRITRSLKLPGHKILDEEPWNNKYASYDKLTLLLLLPFFNVKDVYHFQSSKLQEMFSWGKDVFYRFLNNENINWRDLNYGITKKLINKSRKLSSTDSTNELPTCLIVDDTDLPKTGRCIELVGRIFSHVSHSSLLGFKGLFMAYHDGKSLFSLDCSLHGEKGKNKKRPFGLSPKQLKRRYTKKRAVNSYGRKRHDEFFDSKIQTMIDMIRRAMAKGIRFDYLLVDSWFTCHQLVKFIASRRTNCHLLGMIKMGKTKYTYKEKELSVKQILEALRRSKKIKRSKATGFYYTEATVMFKGIPVKLFLSKTSRRGKWHGLLTTDLDISFEKAYKTYSTRWSIEVFFKEGKQHLRLGKCESQDFDAQIAHTSLCMAQYNILSLAKRFAKYETLGELFRQANADSLELTISERVWRIILSMVAELAEIFEIDPETFMEKIITENERITKLINLEPYLKTG